METRSTASVARVFVDLGRRAVAAVNRKGLIPSAEDKKLIQAFLLQLDERRVFHAPLHNEVVPAALGSLDEVRRKALDIMGGLSNAPAKESCRCCSRCGPTVRRPLARVRPLPDGSATWPCWRRP